MIAAAKIASAPSGDRALSLGSGTARRRWLAPVTGGLRRAAQVVRQLGPYAAIELLLPGGSLLAIALWLYRRNRLTRQVRPLGAESC
jgi:hypothetical protein